MKRREHHPALAVTDRPQDAAGHGCHYGGFQPAQDVPLSHVLDIVGPTVNPNTNTKQENA